MKTGEWNETFNFDEEETDLTTAYENTDNIMMMDSVSVAGKCSSVFVKIIIKNARQRQKNKVFYNLYTYNFKCMYFH